MYTHYLCLQNLFDIRSQCVSQLLKLSDGLFSITTLLIVIPMKCLSSFLFKSILHNDYNPFIPG